MTDFEKAFAALETAMATDDVDAMRTAFANYKRARLVVAAGEVPQLRERVAMLEGDVVQLRTEVGEAQQRLAEAPPIAATADAG